MLYVEVELGILEKVFFSFTYTDTSYTSKSFQQLMNESETTAIIIKEVDCVWGSIGKINFTLFTI